MTEKNKEKIPSYLRASLAFLESEEMQDYQYSKNGTLFDHAYFTDFDAALSYPKKQEPDFFEDTSLEGINYSITKYIPNGQGQLTEHCTWYLSGNLEFWYFDYGIDWQRSCPDWEPLRFLGMKEHSFISGLYLARRWNEELSAREYPFAFLSPLIHARPALGREIWDYMYARESPYLKREGISRKDCMPVLEELKAALTL